MTRPLRSSPTTCLNCPTHVSATRSRCRFPARRCSTSSTGQRQPRVSRWPALEEEFPGIRRTILEHHLRYTFVRFGVPYVVSVICFDAGVPATRCRPADRRQVAQRFLRALRVAGGCARRHPHAARPLPDRAPRQVSQTSATTVPASFLSGTGFRGQGGRAGLHRLFADPFPARRRAGLCQFAAVPASATASTAN